MTATRIAVALAVCGVAAAACGSNQAPTPATEPAPVLSNVNAPDAATPDARPPLPALADDQWCGTTVEASAADAFYGNDPLNCPSAVELSGGGAPRYHWCLWPIDGALGAERSRLAGERQCCYQRDPYACQLWPRGAR